MLMDRQHARCPLNLRESLWKWSSKLCHKPWFIILLAEPGKCPVVILYSSSYRLCNNYLLCLSLKNYKTYLHKKSCNLEAQFIQQEHVFPPCLRLCLWHHTTWTFDHLPSKKKNISFNWMNPRHLLNKITLSWIIAEWDSAGPSSPDEDFHEETDKCSFPVHKWCDADSLLD